MPPPPHRSGIWDRLGTYAMGVGIGCMLVIALLMLRRTMVRPPAPPPAPPAHPAPAP